MESVPNINEKAGVSRDYILAFGTLDNYLRRTAKKEEPRWIFLSKNAFLDRPILKYGEYFPASKYKNVVNDQNRGAIKKLDALVDELNAMRTKKDADYEVLSNIWKQINEIISGSNFPS